MLFDTSRNGCGRNVSPSRIRILPACSRTNDRAATVGEATSPTGASTSSETSLRSIAAGSMAGVGRAYESVLEDGPTGVDGDADSGAGAAAPEATNDPPVVG